MKIEDYALVGDLHTAALVSKRGSVDWLCLPRFDSPSCFTSLLGEPENGHWTLAPTDASATSTRRYIGDSLVLETTWVTATGSIQVIDFMPPLTPAPDMVRLVVGVSGEVEVESVLRARFDYGRSVPWVTSESGARGSETRMVAGPDSLYLRTPAQTQGHGLSMVSRALVKAGERLPFTLLWHPSHEYSPDVIDPEAELERTLDFWSTQLSTCTYAGEHRDAVVRSLATLKALTYAPTGGIVAAPTTSLPELIGGVRNWDYYFVPLKSDPPRDRLLATRR
jgi:GH15 family glucan-1,4-alpha-glucosidase